MKKLIYFVTAFCMLLSLNSCCEAFMLLLACGQESFDLPESTYLNFTNNSKDSLYTYIALGDRPWSITAYPDTLLPPSDTTFIGKKAHILPLHKWHSAETDSLVSFIGDQKYYLQERLPKDTLSVFIISCDTLNKYGYDVVAKENRILVRYDLSIPDLERMNYNIPYPPALWMKETKMFPSYDEVINRYK